MNRSFHFQVITTIVLMFHVPGLAQESLEERLDRVEARLDTLYSFHGVPQRKADTSDVLRDSSNILWGISGPIGVLLDKNFFVINYHGGWKISRWVAYYLSVSELQGEVGRTNDFRRDRNLPEGSRAELIDYRRSGYDRGHMAPAAGFKRSREAMSTTFLLSNMSPQTPKLNRRIWKKLESEVRDLVRLNGEAWVFTGNIFMSVDSQLIAPSTFIGQNRVAVPTHCFKAILSSNESGDYSAFAFLLPNDRSTIPGTTADYLMTVDRLEEITGYDFFPILEDSVEIRIERILPSVWPF